MKANSSELGDRLCLNQHEILKILQGKLAEGIELIDGVIGDKSDRPTIISVATKSGPVKSFRYAARLKGRLERTLADIKRWHELYDPSWLLLLPRISTRAPAVEHLSLESTSVGGDNFLVEIQTLQRAVVTNASDQPGRSVFVEDEALIRQLPATGTRPVAPFAELRVVLKGDGTTLIADGDCQSTEKDARDLARVLKCSATNRFGLLTCDGILRTASLGAGTKLQFLFQVPTGLTHPKTLRQSLLAGAGPGHTPSLNTRMQIALDLVKAILFFHGARFVHKSVCPENIVLFTSDDTPATQSFLLGFRKFRLEDGRTFMSGDETWCMNLYRHPKRQGIHPETEYVMQHDIYSLGVNLLEIGLWNSFVVQRSPEDDSHNDPADPSQLLVPAAFLDITDVLKMKDNRAKAFAIKRQLVSITQSYLPAKMGVKYTDIVLDCLTCLDPDNARFGNDADFQDDDGISVGVRYVEKVISALEVAAGFVEAN